MNQQVKDLSEAMESSLEILRSLSARVEMLESNIEENAVQRTAVMLLLRALVQVSPERGQCLELLERMTAQMQVQPGILLDGDKSTFQRMKENLNWMTEPRAQD